MFCESFVLDSQTAPTGRLESPVDFTKARGRTSASELKSVFTADSRFSVVGSLGGNGQVVLPDVQKTALIVTC